MKIFDMKLCGDYNVDHTYYDIKTIKENQNLSNFIWDKVFKNGPSGPSDLKFVEDLNHLAHS